jgi:Xaa-Pro aminopeptidase
MAQDEALETSASAGAPVASALLEWMKADWTEDRNTTASPLSTAKRCAARRQALSAVFPETPLVVPCGEGKVRANDTLFRFRPGSDFTYLLGGGEAGEVLVFLPQPGAGHEAVLFTEPDTEYSRSEFFTDHAKGALWVGAPRGIRASESMFGVEARPLDQLANTLADCHGPALVRGVDPMVDNLVQSASSADGELRAALSELRLYKDDGEIRELEEACLVTRRGFEDIVRALPTIGSEREVEALFQFRAQTEAGGVGYTPIAAAGSHATILHWIRRDGALRSGELLLVDAGAETSGYYTADVTRTLPISGTFSGPQRQIYELVSRAHEAAVGEVRPGVDFLAPHRAAMAVVTEGLSQLGVLGVPPEEALREDRQLYKRYTIHGVSHMLGLDVHDCSYARPELSTRGPLAAGMVLTVEPGIYFQLNDEKVPQEYRGIGVRIEDDILVTETGHRVLSVGLPVAPDEVERWMAGIWSSTGAI